MPVAGHDEVDAVGPGLPGPEVRLEVWREVRDHDLPVGARGVEPGLQPRHLLLPEAPEPALAVPHGRWARHSARGILGVVPQRAHVVAGVVVRVVGIVEVGIQEEHVHREVCVEQLPAPIQCRGQPPVAGRPGVLDSLVPAHGEHVPAVVVVPQDAHPWLAGQIRTGVDCLEDVLPLPRSGHFSSIAPAVSLDAAPVKIVSGIENETRLSHVGPDLHLGCDQRLRLVIDTPDKGPPQRPCLVSGPWRCRG
mmetsp:Transcript_109018/g.338593  ORF Transcript_109018/g.338593 Transcript_109018/m.338593 type:complete len:250 (-) Transcript_109018:263-1012(-)